MSPNAAKNLNIAGALGLSSVLIGGYIFQFVLWEFPCPLCLLVRMGFLGMITGFMLNVKFGIRPSHYGITLISSIFCGMVAMRQTLLHIVPGTGEYGTPVWGLHLYTWAFIISAATVLIIGIILMFDRKQFDQPVEEPGVKLAGFANIVFIVMILLAVANAVTAFFECGITPCPDDPTQYKVIQEIEGK